MPLSPGQTLKDRYRIVKLLGQGGFGAVYKAWDLNLERPRALKENLDTSPQAQRQFKREAQILSDLTHPNLPKVIDHFTLPGQYLVMEFVEGEDLGEMLQRLGGPLPGQQVLEWIEQICDALIYLHTQNPSIIHRDLKPANIKVTPDGKAKLVDFGIAKVYDPQLSTTMGARAVTPGYSPQEQYGMGTTDARTDVYALGATLYHLLTGQQPPESIQRNIDDSLAAPRSLNAAISAEAESAILKAMQPHPGQRFQSVGEMKGALGGRQTMDDGRQTTATQVVGEAVSYPSVPATAAPKATIAMLRNAPWEWIWIGSSLILIAVILAAAFWGGGGGSDYTATQTAEALALLPTPAPTIYIIKALTILPSETPTAVPSDIPTSFPLTTPTLVPTNTPTPIKLLSRIVDDFGVSMALVPAGEFLMGSAENDRFAGNDEKPQHRVCLDAYYINVYEVTNVLYEACVQAGVCTLPGESKSNTRSRYYSNPTYDNFPVIYVDWNQAQAYCQWRGSDLPSEAQWEKAARGGLEGKKYPWGDEAPDCSWVNFDWDMGNADAYCVDDTNVVGSYSPNGYGLYDMAGNVWEWVQDLYEVTFYSSSPYKNPTGPSLGEDRVLRGGSWWGSVGTLRVAFRTSCPPSKRIDVLGFRCARSPRDGITEALKRVIPLMVQMAGACVEGSAVSYFAVVQ